jgi:hypothetical protein
MLAVLLLLACLLPLCFLRCNPLLLGELRPFAALPPALLRFLVSGRLAPGRALPTCAPRLLALLRLGQLLQRSGGPLLLALPAPLPQLLVGFRVAVVRSTRCDSTACCVKHERAVFVAARGGAPSASLSSLLSFPLRFEPRTLFHAVPASEQKSRTRARALASATGRRARVSVLLRRRNGHPSGVAAAAAAAAHACAQKIELSIGNRFHRPRCVRTVAAFNVANAVRTHGAGQRLIPRSLPREQLHLCSAQLRGGCTLAALKLAGRTERQVQLSSNTCLALVKICARLVHTAAFTKPSI